VFGAESLVSGVIGWVTECAPGTFSQLCSGTQIWQVLAPAIAGGILIVFAIVFFALAHGTRGAIPPIVAPPWSPPPPP
jgi:hypothetical protein